MTQTTPAAEPLLSSGEVAALFGVTVKTVGRWAQDGRFTAIRTPGGHRRYRRDEVHFVLAMGGKAARS